MPKTASLYLRLSKASNEESTGLKTQEAELRALCKTHGLAVVAVHVDDGKSGALRNRKGWLAWLEDGRSGRADHLLAYRIDRVSRGGHAGLGRFFDTINGTDYDTGKRIQSKVRFLSPDGLDSSLSSWIVQSALLAALAEQERETIRDRNIKSSARRAFEGRYQGGTIPTGFRVVPNPNGAGQVLDVVDSEAEVLREATARLIAGKSVRSVTRFMNASSLPPRRVQFWSRVSIIQTLNSQAVQTKILAPAERRALAEALAANKIEAKNGNQGRRASRLLSGLLVCNGCRTPLHVSRESRDARGSRYTCRRALDSQPCPGSVSIKASIVEEGVTKLWLDSWGHVNEVRRTTQADERADQIALIKDAMDVLKKAFNEAERDARREIYDALNKLDDDLTEAEALPVKESTIYLETGRTYGQAFESEDLEGKRAMIRDTLDGPIVVKKGKPGRKTLDPSRIESNITRGRRRVRGVVI